MTTLSYIIATRNKLPYLKAGLEKLIAHKKPDEEILVADGASTDGTPEYLAELKAAGKIEYFVSEKDFGLAHALNKLVLVSNGTLLKYLTDDDAFDYGVIQKCRTFMLEHPEVDLVNTEGGSLNDPSRMAAYQDPLQVVRALNYEEPYKQWQQDHTPFYFCDLGIIFRRSSLPVTGFWNVLFPGPDIELSLRTSKGRVNIAWYTGYSYVNISNPQSVSVVFMQKTKRLTERLDKLYFDKNPDSLIVRKLKVLRNKLRSGLMPKTSGTSIPFQEQWPELIKTSEKWLELKNLQKEPEFLVKPL
ncbi:MAG: glycosyltransferase [Candidatus Sungbacteria bacterium]|nr:glycosyltransferase [Candidatus Sungbacteria bacterium]